MSMPKIVTHMQLWLRALRGPPGYKLKYGGRPKPSVYIAEGGPYNGKALLLVDGTTAPLRVGNQRGIYRCGVVAVPHRSIYGNGTTVWKPSIDG